MAENQDFYRTATPQSAAEVFSSYKEYLLEVKQSHDLGMVQTALVRFTIPGWGGPSPKGARASSTEIQAGLEFLQQISLEQLQNALAVQEQTFNQLAFPKTKQRRPRFYLKKLVDWAAEKGWTGLKTDAGEQVEIYRFKRRHHRRPHATDTRMTSRIVKTKYILDKVEISPKLQSDFDAFTVFLQKHLNHRKITADREVIMLRQIFGWLYRLKNTPLDKLSFEFLIPVVQLRFKLQDFKKAGGDYTRLLAETKMLAREEAQETAKDMLFLINEFLDFYSDLYQSRSRVIETLVKLAKFLYRNETDSTIAEKFNDIPAVINLRKLSAQITKRSKEQPQAVPFEQKSIPWEEVFEVLKKLQKEADLEFTYHLTGRNGRPQKVKRKGGGRAKSIQKFLIIALFTVMPPERSRTIRELELGRTLVCGLSNGSNFIPVEKVQDKKQSKWYIHLSPEDYKTGKAYGEYWGEIPNVKFSEDKTLYYYINLWLNEHRAVLNPQHNFVFTAHNGKPIQAGKMWDIVRNVFFRFTGVPVTAKELRRMYVTYLKDNGASEAELDAAAVAMHHSRRTQSEDYDKQEKQNKVAPIYKFNQNVFNKVFGSSL
ncbi:hypothetical protein H6F86_16695 [Phormidium sp. FACHB-592]|uniref:Core-binding (CB) domain-containing protein n=1 Tax=Stenomitos frigidus AS-A4 TaxID=2933935 RepID=A0ABV0KPB7_9CYAN|nr:hypothetical protein [Phormidium sp. FACHB-592]MBD2075504.1 hypothetical protein [Phormidium sp. FACHB-592]